MIKTLFIFGTRPEAIKLAPVIITMNNNPDFKPIVVVTAQHRVLLDQVLSTFDITSDYDLNIMKKNQSLIDITLKSLKGLDRVISEVKPDLVVVQGDTTSAFAGALASFYQKIPLAHIEAGLRSGSKNEPFPEEVNRILTGVLTSFHFAPTIKAKQNLISEGVPENSILVTGNTVIDSLKFIIENKIVNNNNRKKSDYLLLEVHRRENWGLPMKEIFLGIIDTLKNYPNLEVIFPVHPNPVIKKLAVDIFKGYSNVKLIKPQKYQDFIELMKDSRLIVTDSGGIQEEVSYLKKPLVLTRRLTERPEGVDSGFIFISGVTRKEISDTIRKILDSPKEEFIKKDGNVFGDGNASQRIIQGIRWFLGVSQCKPSEFI